LGTNIVILEFSIDAIDGYNIANQKDSNNTAIATTKKEGRFEK